MKTAEQESSWYEIAGALAAVAVVAVGSYIGGFELGQRQAAPAAPSAAPSARILATSIARTALQVNRQESGAVKERLLKEFVLQIGDVARNPATLKRLLDDEMIDRDEFQFIGGEVRQVGDRLCR